MSTQTITFRHRVAGVLTNVTSAVLSDPTETYGVKRNDTSAVVVANNTAITNVSTGVYQYTFTEPAAGLTYTSYIEYVYNGVTHRIENQITGTSDNDWFYADQQAVEDLIGVEALRIISNEPGAATNVETDVARVQRVGQLVDQEMDARLSVMGFETPLANMSAGTALLMRDASARLVAWKLNEPRMLLSLSSSRAASHIDKIMDEHRKVAEMTLNKIAWRQISITADRLYARPPFAKVHVPAEPEVITAL